MKARTFKPSGLAHTCFVALLLAGLPLFAGGDGTVISEAAAKRRHASTSISVVLPDDPWCIARIGLYNCKKHGGL